MPYIDANGEITATCPDCDLLRDALTEAKAHVERLEDGLSAAERDLRSKRLRISQLESAKDAARLADPNRPLIVELFSEWRRLCKHPRSHLDGERHDALLWALKTYGEELVRLAIYGASVGAATRRGRKFDDVARHVCDGAYNFERFANLGASLRGENDG